MFRLYMRRFVTLREEEKAGEGAAGGGTDTGSASAAGSQQAASDAPKSMLEAIERGLGQQSTDASAAGTQTEQEQQAAADRARDEQGRFAKKAEEQAADPAAAAAAKKAADDQAAKEKAAKEGQQGAKPGDENQMPEGLAPKAQERFRTLTHRLQETTVRAERAEADLGEFRTVLKNTGGRPEDFAQAFDYITALNKGDFQSALNMLEAQRKQLSLMLGRPLPGSDVLADYPDLRQRVDGYQMDEQAAIEIARARRMQQTQQDQQRRHQAESQQVAQVTQTRQQALADVDKLNREWSARDPDYAVKEEIILKQIPLIASEFPPNMWAAQVRILYDSLSAMPAQQAQRAAAAAPAPLRPSGQQGGARKPSSMLEALDAGLGYSSR